MLLKYIQAAMDSATYEIIDDEEPYYGEISALQGVWANGRTLEECRRNLTEVVEAWLLLSIAQHLPIPKLGEIQVMIPEENVVHG
ncbi:MAG TPA: type II toxin-antitoxin system HicB family antitoxin [bacterium]|nr:type II toxin-antitoxin system HicB family antitoxin [bacterium]HPG85048.1 type II toxin-antitoxin system HicB family antitoxin [bacterium]